MEKHLFVPDHFFEGSLDEFWSHLPELDADFENRRKALEAEGKRLRFVATMDHGKTSVSLKEVDNTHPFYNLEGSTNIVMLSTERTRSIPCSSRAMVPAPALLLPACLPTSCLSQTSNVEKK